MTSRASTLAAQAPAATAPPRLYLFNPGVDLSVIAGGLTFLLFPLCLAISSRLDVATFLVLLFFVNYPHYMATNYRIYRNRSQIERYKIFSIYITGLLVLTALIGHLMAAFWVKVLYTVYFTWSPFHYTGQNYGISLMYLRRGGTEPSNRERWLLYLSFICCFLMYVASINGGSGAAPLFPFVSAGLPPETVRVAYLVLLVVGVGCAAGFLAGVVPRTTRRTMTPVLLLMGAQFAWFAAATGVPLFSEQLRLQWLPIEVLFPTIAFMHCAQYLGVTAYYAKRDQTSENRSFSFLRYFAVLVIGGVFLWIGTTRLLSQVFSLDYGISFLIMLSLINIHHFLMDGAIWKLRDGRIARLLIAPATAERQTASPLVRPDASARQRRKARKTSQPAAHPAPAGGAPAAERPWWNAPAWALACVAALALAGTDIYYRLGILQANQVSRTGDSQAAMNLYSSVSRFSPHSSEALDGLAFWDLKLGKIQEAIDHWSRSAALNPTETSAYAHIGLGEAYLDAGRLDESIRHLQKAIELRPQEPSSYILLASAYDQQGDRAKAEETRAHAPQAAPAPAAAKRVFY